MKKLPLVLTFNVRRVCRAAHAVNTRPSAFVLVCVNNAGLAVRRVVRCCLTIVTTMALSALPCRVTPLTISRSCQTALALILTRSTLPLSLLTMLLSVLVE